MINQFSWAVEQNPPSDIPLAWICFLGGWKHIYENIPNDDWIMTYHGRIRKKTTLKPTHVHWGVHDGILKMVYDYPYLNGEYVIPYLQQSPPRSSDREIMLKMAIA